MHLDNIQEEKRTGKYEKKKKGGERELSYEQANAQVIPLKASDPNEIKFNNADPNNNMHTTVGHLDHSSFTKTGCVAQTIWPYNEIHVGIQTSKRDNVYYSIHTHGERHVLHYTMEGYDGNTTMSYIAKQRLEGKNRTSHKRDKIFITDIISIAIGTAATTLATRNAIQMHNLQMEIKSITTSVDSIQNSINDYNRKLFQVTKGQITTMKELIHTQTALNNTIAVVNEHAKVLKRHRIDISTIMSMIMLLRKELTSFTHAVETHFIHESIEDIVSNKLNLRFIHHYDLPRVIKTIKKQINIDMDEKDATLPIVELIIRLLIQQRIEFAPIATTQQATESIIGNLLFISLFAAANKNQQSFSTYELIPMPFNQRNQRVKLAQTLHVIGISKKIMELIQWTRKESSACKFISMSSCRETPPINRNWNHTCLFEILTDLNLTLCCIKREVEQIFKQRVGQQWAISTRNKTKCHRVTQLEQSQHTIASNNELTMPSMALITIDKSTAWSCDNFLLPSIKNGTNEFISIIDNRKLKHDDSNLIDLHKAKSYE